MIRAGGILIGLFMIALMSAKAPWAIADPAAQQYVRTESGKVRCDVQPGTVGCQYLPGFPQAPVDNWGGHPDIAKLTSGGAFSWMEGNLATGGSASLENDVILNYGQSYDIQGWTILPNSDGTRFTNDGTGHGMFVSVDNVSSF
jgi:hypothetical protein